MVLLSKVASRFLQWASKCRHAKTVSVYRHYFEKFLKEVGDREASRVTKSDLAAWAVTWHQSQAIVRLYRWACDDAALLKTNPVAKFQHPPKGERRRVLSKREQTKLLGEADEDFRDLLIAYQQTFARPGELRRVTWNDLYPKVSPKALKNKLKNGDAFLVLWDYKNRRSRRLPNAPRVILLSPKVGRLICKLMGRKHADADNIFKTARGVAWTANALRCRWRRLRAKLGFTRDANGEQIVPYTWRHTGATEASAHGIRDRILADVLGHVETSTTKRYQHLQTADLLRPMKKFWRRTRRRA